MYRPITKDSVRISGAIILALTAWVVFAALTTDMHIIWKTLGIAIALPSLYVGIRMVTTRTLIGRL